jgi:deazaflavin-dependent oxidoreductase (nitroreductase family)
MDETAAVQSFEDGLVADMRAHGGRVTEGPLAGHPILIMISEGAKSGEPRRSILTWSRDGDDYIVAGTAGGAPTVPGWVYNVQANPEVTIEVDNVVVPARAQAILEGQERDRLWEQHVAALPWFADYPAQTGRVIPMVRLTAA